MGLLIILIIIGVIWYRHQEQEDADEETNKSPKTFEQFQEEQKESSQDNSFYISEIPYGIRRKTAMDTYLQSERSNITKGFDVSNKKGVSNSENDSEDKEVTADDLLVNTSTGELTTPQMAFNKPEDDLSERSSSNDSIIPVFNDSKTTSSNLVEGISTFDESKNSQNKKNHWRENNYKSIDDILKFDFKERIK